MNQMIRYIAIIFSFSILLSSPHAQAIDISTSNWLQAQREKAAFADRLNLKEFSDAMGKAIQQVIDNKDPQKEEELLNQLRHFIKEARRFSQDKNNKDNSYYTYTSSYFLQHYLQALVLTYNVQTMSDNFFNKAHYNDPIINALLDQILNKDAQDAAYPINQMASTISQVLTWAMWRTTDRSQELKNRIDEAFRKHEQLANTTEIESALIKILNDYHLTRNALLVLDQISSYMYERIEREYRFYDLALSSTTSNFPDDTFLRMSLGIPATLVGLGTSACSIFVDGPAASPVALAGVAVATGGVLLCKNVLKQMFLGYTKEEVGRLKSLIFYNTDYPMIKSSCKTLLEDSRLVKKRSSAIFHF